MVSSKSNTQTLKAFLHQDINPLKNIMLGSIYNSNSNKQVGITAIKNIEQGSSTRGDLPPRGHLVMSGDILGCGMGGHLRGTRDAAKLLTVHRTPPSNKE